MSPRRVVGAMTGTSLDAIDVALLRISGQRLSLRCELEHTRQFPLAAIGGRLRAFAEGAALSAAEICALSRDFALAHCDAIRELLAGVGPEPAACDLIGIHGQTIFHRPPLSWQLFSPAPVAAEFSCKVICDFRSADIAAGGQGAPLTPIADFVLFGSEQEPRAVLNLGGFANFTCLPRRATPALNLRDLARVAEHSGAAPLRGTPLNAAGRPAAQDAEPTIVIDDPTIEDVRGGDICACNHVLDGFARRLLSQPFDPDGAAAARGRRVDLLVERIRASLATQSSGARSLGTGDELNALVAALAAAASVEDVLRSACAALAETIADAIRATDSNVARLLIAGGGARNQTLFGELQRAAAQGGSIVVEPTDAHGVSASHREAIAFAVLADLCDQGVPIALPKVTGAARAVRAGLFAYGG